MIKMGKSEIEILTAMLEDPKTSTLENSAEFITKMEAFAQEYDISSVPDLYLKYLNNLGSAYARAGNLSRATEVFNQLLNASTAQKKSESITRALTNLATLEANKGNFHYAIASWEKLLKRKLSPQLRQGVLINLSIGYSMAGQPFKALKYGFRIIEQLEQAGKESDLVSALTNQGIIYHHLDEFDNAIKYWERALGLAEQHNLTRGIGMLCNSLSVGYSNLQQTDKALEYADRNLQLRLKYGSLQDLANAYHNIGTIYEDAKDYATALKYYETALDKMQTGEDISQMANCYLSIASIKYHYQLYAEALGYIDEAAKLNNENSDAQTRKRCHQHYAKNYKALGDFQKALEYTEEMNQECHEKIDAMTQSMITKTEAEYYRHKIEEQASQYKVQNIELKKRNKIIRHKTQALLWANTDLQQKNEVLGRLMSILSHDVRAPIANVVQLLGLVNRGDLSESESKELLIKLEANGWMVLNFIGDLLKWISAESRGNIAKTGSGTVDINALLQNVVNLYLPLASYKKIGLEFLAEEVHVSARVNADTLKLVVRNLLNNAIKFTPLGGQIWLKVEESDDQFHILIKDTGTGMSSEEIGELINGKLSSKKGTVSEEGVGIGFKLCREYINRMKGTIEVKSILLQGTEFRISLPRE